MSGGRNDATFMNFSLPLQAGTLPAGTHTLTLSGLTDAAGNTTNAIVLPNDLVTDYTAISVNGVESL